VRDLAGTVAPSWLARVRDALHEHFADPPSLAELACDADVHPDHLGRTFRRYYGLTPGAYVRRVRLERAIRLIVDTQRPLAEIAYATGFADQSHMTRQVGDATGLPPGRLRDTG
jgi:AraC family transcriptional regulator